VKIQNEVSCTERLGAGYFGQYLSPLRPKSLPLWTFTKNVQIKKREKYNFLLITTEQRAAMILIL